MLPALLLSAVTSVPHKVQAPVVDTCERDDQVSIPTTAIRVKRAVNSHILAIEPTQSCAGTTTARVPHGIVCSHVTFTHQRNVPVAAVTGAATP
jgi:hypothetical protein